MFRLRKQILSSFLWITFDGVLKIIQTYIWIKKIDEKTLDDNFVVTKK